MIKNPSSRFFELSRNKKFVLAGPIISELITARTCAGAGTVPSLCPHSDPAVVCVESFEAQATCQSQPTKLVSGY